MIQRFVMSIATVLLLAALGACGTTLPLLQREPAQISVAAAEVETLAFDVAENLTKVSVVTVNSAEDGSPGYGNPFISQGYIYPMGTLDGSNGVLENGDPEFPDKVVGTWICYGWTWAEGMQTKHGPKVVSKQIFQLGDETGQEMLVTEGFELADVNVPVSRAITGGTGRYSQARGESVETLRGANASGGGVFHFAFKVTK